MYLHYTCTLLCLLRQGLLGRNQRPNQKMGVEIVNSVACVPGNIGWPAGSNALNCSTTECPGAQKQRVQPSLCSSTWISFCCVSMLSASGGARGAKKGQDAFLTVSQLSTSG